MKLEPASSAGQLHALRSALVAGYQAEDLHQLRVLLRRIRSELRHLGGDAAMELQNAFGELARSTNAARDWDTLDSCARACLHPADYDRLRPVLAKQLAAAHEQTQRMLHSPGWHAALRRWQVFLQARDVSALARTSLPANFQRAVARAQKGCERALSEDSARSWHKLRIAIKELRYTLEGHTPGAAEPSAQQLIEQCKVLQTRLGEWHDTVVHRQLLESQFVDALDHPETATGRAARELHDRLQQRGRQLLEQLRTDIAQGFPCAAAP